MKSISLYGTINLFDQKLLEKSWGLCYNIIVKKSDRNKVFYEFFGRDTMLNEDYCWTILKLSYPDTYDFLKSLENELETIGDY